MKSSSWLRIAAVMTAFQAVAHTVGGVLGPVHPGAQAIAAAAMKANSFSAMGNTRTFWDFFLGFGLCVSVFLVLEAGLLWILSNSLHNNESNWRPLFLLLMVCNVAIGILGVRFFFPATLVAPAINVICLGVVLVGNNTPNRDTKAGQSLRSQIKI